jgi:hypothetical protein
MIVTKLLRLFFKLQIQFNFVLKVYATKFVEVFIDIKGQGVRFYG